MKRLLAIVAALCVMGALYAVTAPAGQQGASAAKVAQLSRQVKTLNRHVKKLNRRVNTLSTRVNTMSVTIKDIKNTAIKIGKIIVCFTKPVPVNQYPGYATVAGTSTTALDVAHSGDPVSSYLLALHPLCIPGLSASR